MRPTTLLLCLLPLATFGLGSAFRTQQGPDLPIPPASPPALVRDQVGLTTVEIAYARPHARERKIFGGLVPYGEVWRTGANSATRITFSGDVTFGGAAVPAGTYGLFTVPGEERWTVILNGNPEQWGAYAYDEAKDVARVEVPVQRLGQRVESLTLGLSDLRGDHASLDIAWETTRVSVPIVTDLVATVGPRIAEVMAGDAENKPYLAAAMFYYEHDLDLAKALEWIEAARQAQPGAVWVVYRKGLVQAKAGDQAGALESARAGLEMARQAGGALGAEYAGLCEALIARLGG